MRGKTMSSLGTLAVALTICAGASAAAPRALVVSVGDAVAIAGTKVVCYVVSGQGQKGIACFLIGSKGLTPGTYGAALAASGKASVDQVKADRTPTSIFSRSLKSASGQKSHIYEVKVGDIFGFNVPNGTLGCSVIEITTGDSHFRGRKVACWLANAKSAFPKSYGIAVSNTFAGLFSFDALGNAGPDVYTKFQP
jgi:hypothetical protein